MTARPSVRVKVEDVGRGDRVWHDEPRWHTEQTVANTRHHDQWVTLTFCRGLDQPRGLGPYVTYRRGTIVTAERADRCAICDQPETLTDWGTFVPCGDGVAHKGCDQQAAIDEADNYTAVHQ